MTTFIRVALKESQKGIHRSHKIGAVLCKGGQVITKKYNIARIYGLDNRGFHAEERIIRSCSKEQLKGAILVVARNTHSMSRPCKRCYNLIKNSGIKKIVYCNWEKDICIEKVEKEF